jgi:hypothetical protein
MSVIAYHGKEELKAQAVNEMRAHRLIGRREKTCTTVSPFLKRYDFADGKVFTIHGVLGVPTLEESPAKVGFSVRFMRVADTCFTDLAWHGDGIEHVDFAISLLEAVPCEADTELIWRRWMYWLLSGADSPLFYPGQRQEIREAVAAMASLYKDWLDTGAAPAGAGWVAAAEIVRDDVPRILMRKEDDVLPWVAAWLVAVSAGASPARIQGTWQKNFRTMAAKLIEISKQERP